MDPSSPYPDRRHRRATVVFADISGFTRLAERLDPERLLELTEACHAAMERATVEDGGTIDKFIGDAVMALFGAERGLEDTAGRAVAAALAMRESVDALAKEFDLPATVGLHIGIDTGSMIAGHMGGDERKDFTVLGDVVNVASRLQGKATVGEILVGPATHRETLGRYAFQSLGALSLAGRDKPVEAYAILGVAGSAAEGLAVQPLLGRSDEIQVFENALDNITVQGGVIWLEGEPGIGKSRLLAELVGSAGDRGLRCATGRAETTGRLRTFRALAELLEDLLETGTTTEGDPATEVVRDAFREAGLSPADRTEALLLRLLGKPLDAAQTASVQDLEADVLRVLQQKTVADLLAGMAQREPLVLCFEDVHWLDPSTRRILGDLFWIAREHRVLFVLTTRPDFPETTGALATALRATSGIATTELNLGPLNPAQSREVLLNALGTSSLPTELRVKVGDRAGGNPFFLEEIARTLRDFDAVRVVDGRTELNTEIGDLPLPGTVEETIMARVDRLTSPERELLEFASVLGRIAPLRLLHQVAPDHLDVDGVLAKLVERGILCLGSGEETSETEFRFTHALIQEATYRGMLSSRRRQLHGALAQEIEASFSEENLIGYQAMLALHYLAAGKSREAQPHLIAAGNAAAANAASAEALEYFESAYRIRQESNDGGMAPEDSTMLERRLATSLLQAGYHERARPFFDAAAAGLGETRRWTTPRQAQFYLMADVARIFFRVFILRGKMSRRPADAEMRDRLALLYERARAESIADPEHFLYDSMRLTALVTSVEPGTVKQSFPLYAGAALLFAYSGLSFRISRRFASIAGNLVHESNPDDIFTYRLMLFLTDYFEGNWKKDHGIDEDLIKRVLATGRLWDVDTFLGVDHLKAIEEGDFDRAARRRQQVRNLLEAYGYRFSATTRDALEVYARFGEKRWGEALAAVEIYKQSPMPMLNLLATGLEGRILAEMQDWKRLDAVLEAGSRLEKEVGRVTPFHGCHLAIARQAGALNEYQVALQTSRNTRPARRKAARAAKVAAGIAERMAPIRVPNLRLEARLAALNGQEEKAAKLFQKARREAESLGQGRELEILDGKGI